MIKKTEQTGTGLQNDDLLQLYQAACKLPLVDFQAMAIDTLAENLSFDAAWWGLASIVGGKTHVHFSHQQNLPSNLARIVNLTDGNNTVTQACQNSIGTTVNFNTESLYGNPSTAISAGQLNIKQLLCTQTLDRTPNTWNVIALIRNNTSNPFSEEERLLKQSIVPHLSQMMQINRFAQLTELRSISRRASYLTGIMDDYGIVHTYETGFGRLLRSEWPNWDGVLLPTEARAVIPVDKYVGQKLIVRFENFENYILITLIKKSKLDLLSSREQAIAAEFSKGNSYKSVAKEFNISPATVRNHLRNIYLKLEISSKVELVKLYADR